MDVVGVVSSTATKGMPYGGRPKSGWSFVDPACIAFSHFALLGLTGSVEMSVFQMLSAGKTLHVVPGTGAARTVAGTREVKRALSPTIAKVRTRLMQHLSARRDADLHPGVESLTRRRLRGPRRPSRRPGA